MQSISTPRKQNSSCDRCRRSKRRCAFAPDVQPGVPNVCLNCAHHGHQCTFDFVSSQSNKRRRKTSVPPPPNEHVAPLHQGRDRSEAREQILAVSPEPSESIQTAPVELLWTETSQTGSLDVDMFMGNLFSEWTSLNNRVLAPVAKAIDATETASSTSRSDSRRSNSPSHDPCEKSLPGLWRGSPIHLLNSSVEFHLVNQSLGEIYDCMMSGIATRYLDYNCNLFAGTYRYSFDPDRSEPSILTQPKSNPLIKPFTPSWKRPIRGVQSEASQDRTLTPEVLAAQINKVTMIGIARFLDNFALLYGNTVEPKARQQDERTLTAVLQVFALQFASSHPVDVSGAASHKDSNSAAERLIGSVTGGSTTNSSHVFTAAWFNAHSHLMDSKQSRSFIHLYSVFLFQMTTVPPEARSTNQTGASALDLLDAALHQMEELQRLISDYCTHLWAGSIYQFLLQSSLGIFHWYGYLRDTVASVLNDRPCILQDAPLRLKGLI